MNTAGVQSAMSAGAAVGFEPRAGEVARRVVIVASQDCHGRLP